MQDMAASQKQANIIILTVSIFSVLRAQAWDMLSRSISRPVVQIAATAETHSRRRPVGCDHHQTGRRDRRTGRRVQKMSGYLKGMAKTAEDIAEGDLRSEVTPKSGKDVLGNAFHVHDRGSAKHRDRRPVGLRPDGVRVSADRGDCGAGGKEQRDRGNGS